eukprot:4629435-Pyramimonas_sp.AAC.1
MTSTVPLLRKRIPNHLEKRPLLSLSGEVDLLRGLLRKLLVDILPRAPDPARACEEDVVGLLLVDLT